MAMQAGSVEVVFSATTAQFIANVKRADDAVTASGRTMENVSNRVRNAWSREVAAQSTRIAKEEQAARASEMAALKADILSRSMEAEATTATRSAAANAQLAERMMAYAGSAERATAANVELAASQRAVSESGNKMGSSSMAAGGVLRELEGNFTNNTRMAGRFLSTMESFAPIMGTAMEVGGALALAGVFWEIAKAAYTTEQNIVELTGALEGLNKVQITVDAKLAKIDNSIEEQIEKVLEHNSGKASALQQKFQYQSQKPIDLSSYFYSEEIKKLPDDVKGSYEATYKAIAPADLPDKLSKIGTEITKVSAALAAAKDPSNFGMGVTQVNGSGPNGDRDPVAYWQARLEMAKQIKSQVQAESDLHGATGQALQGDIAAAQAEEAEKAARAAEEAARRREAAMRAAAERQHKAMEDQLSALRMDHDVSSAEEYEFWNKMLAAAAKYPDNLRQVKERIGQLYQELGRQIEESIAKAVAAQNRLAEESRAAFETLARIDDEWARALHRDADALAELQTVNAKNVEAMQDLVIAHDVATGAISKYDAAVAMASVHAADYAQQLADLRQAQQNDDDTSLSDDQRKAAKDSREKQVATVQGAADRAAMQDQWKEFAETGLGGATAALQQFIAAAKDSSAQWKMLTADAINGINENLVKLFSGQKTNFRGAMADEMRKASLMALQRGEAGIFGAAMGKHSVAADLASKASGLFGKGGPNGSAENPLHVVMAAAGAGMSPAQQAARQIMDDARTTQNMALPPLVNASGLGASISPTAQAAAIVSAAMPALPSVTVSPMATTMSALAKFIPFIPGLADGGYGAGPTLVGERGPEILNLPRGSHVTPNHKLRSVLHGGTTELHVHVDARGTSNPAEIEAAGFRGAMAAAPHIIAATAKAIADNKARTAPGARR